ncbi:hypothetical protein ACG02S_26075, partial [Roseateles sp. DC23W]
GPKGSGELESLSSASKNYFSKVLDDAAKADQNLASLLMTATRKRSLNRERKQVDEYRENKFSKYLTTSEKAD